MNITILTYGSRGDVQPFLPLTLGLMAKGHSVKLAAPMRFKNLIEGYGIQFALLAGDPEDLSRRFNNAGYNFIKMIHELMNHAMEIAADVLHQTEEACKDADLIIHTFAHAVGAHTLACEKNIPDIHIQTFPIFTPTGDYPNIALSDLKIRSLNSLTHVLSQKITCGHLDLDLNKSAAVRDFQNVDSILPSIKIRFALQPQSSVRGAQIFSHPQAIGCQMSM